MSNVLNVPNLRFPGFEGEWETVTLGECSESLDYGMNASATEYDGCNKYIRITDIDEASSKYLSDNPVSPDGELFDKYLVEDNDILFARTGASTGKTYIYDKLDGKLYFAGFLIRAKIKQEYNTLFIFAQTQTITYDKWVKLMSMRSGQPGINSHEYASCKICLPSKQEQDKIASFLSLINQRITTQNQIIEKYESLIKGITHLFFSSHRKLSFFDIPKSWEKVRLADISTVITRKNDHKKSHPVMMISAEKGFINQKERYENDNAGSSLDKYILLHRNELAYNRGSSKLKKYGSTFCLKKESALVPYVYHSFAMNLSICNPVFYGFYLNSKMLDKYLRKIISSTAREDGLLNVSKEDFFNLKVLCPPKNEQDKIADFITQYIKWLQLEKNILLSLQKQKQYLLQNLFI